MSEQAKIAYLKEEIKEAKGGYNGGIISIIIAFAVIGVLLIWGPFMSFISIGISCFIAGILTPFGILLMYLNNKRYNIAFEELKKISF